jgi:hypothetical protein
MDAESFDPVTLTENLLPQTTGIPKTGAGEAERAVPSRARLRAGFFLSLMRNPQKP